METTKTNRIDGTLAGFAIFWTTTLGVLAGTVLLDTPNAKADEAEVIAATEAKDDLGFAIANQGNEALIQIRAESTRIEMPALPPREVVVADAAAFAAEEVAATDVERDDTSELDVSIGSQGNAALHAIRAESTRFVLPGLPQPEPMHLARN